MTLLRERSEPRVIAPDRVPSTPIGTWTIDPSGSRVSLAWRKHRLWTITGRLHCFGIIHLDELPPVGVIQFEPPSGLPVLTIALNPASIEPDVGDLDAMLGGPDPVDAQRHLWWTLHSQSLEVLPTGAWRVMATLTANGTPGPVELHLEFDSEASSPDELVLQGRGVLDRRGFSNARSVSTLTPQIQVDLAVRARRARDPHLWEKGKQLHNQHAGLSQQLAAQRITERHEQATQARLAHGAERPRRRRWQLAPGWWRLGHWPGIAQLAVRHPHRVH